MSKSSKVWICILMAVLILLIAVYVIVDAVTVPTQEVILYPDGELVDSVFVAQNNEYVKNDSLSNTHSFETVPYKVDVPAGNGAKIGTGTVYQVGEEYFVYVSEYTDQYDVQDIVASQFPVALLINYIPEATKITIQQDKNGYINGFKARYLADQLYATDGTSQQRAIILGYALDMPEGKYFGNHLFIAVGTTTMSSAAAIASSQVLSAVMKTARYDEQLEKQQIRDAEKAQEDLERERAQASSAESEVPDGNYGFEGEDDSTLATAVGDEITTSVPIVVAENYSVFNLRVDWTLDNPNAVLELFFPDGNTYATPLEQTNYGVTFALSDVPAGTYTLRIMNYQQCGEIATTLGGTTQ